MLNFAVRHDGMAEGQGTWVLYVDIPGERFLLSSSEGEFYWKPMEECKLVKAHTPDQPDLVLPVTPAPPQNGLAIPEVNRTMRRNGGF